MDQKKVSPKIKPILHQKLDINSPKNIRNLSKNHYTKVKSIHYHPNDEGEMERQFDYFFLCKALTKVFEKIKTIPYKKLDLNRGNFSFLNENHPRMIKLIKRYSHIKELILLYNYNNEDLCNIWKKRIAWLKYQGGK